MILNLKGSVDEEMVLNLTDFINDNTGIKKQIYFSSQGGIIYCAEQIIDMLNNSSKEIEIIGSGILESSAFEIFFKNNCKKRLLLGTRGMMHFATADLTINQKGDVLNKTFLKHMKEDVNERNTELIKKLKLNSKEISTYNKGKDVEFSYKRMSELLENIK